MYADPLDRYGRLSAERFQAARLVVDTGLNVLGWPRERAAAYLRANAVMSETEIGLHKAAPDGQLIGTTRRRADAACGMCWKTVR